MSFHSKDFFLDEEMKELSLTRSLSNVLFVNFSQVTLMYAVDMGFQLSVAEDVIKAFKALFVY